MLLTTPRITTAQRSTAIHRIGELEVGPAALPDEISERMAPLRELGWIEGKNLHVERRYASSIEELKPLAEELVRAEVEVIVADGPNPTRAAMRATSSIPIVFRAVSDPVLSGLVTNLARPNGNVTGFSAAAPEVDAKRLSLAKELVPTLKRIGMLETLGNPQFGLFRGKFEQTCRELRLESIFVKVSARDEIDGAIATLVQQHVQVLMLVDDSFAVAHGYEIIGAALKRGVPTITSWADFVRRTGALMSYSTTEAEANRRAAYYVDKILRGARPTDLPVEQATQFQLVINLQTARALGVTVPQSVLVSADEVIR